MAFLYSLFLKLLYPTSLCLVLLVASAAFRKHMVVRRVCFGASLAVLLVCGNGWLVGALTKHLEWQNLPLDPVPHANAILVLSGGIHDRIPPRPTVEVGEAGDRMLYGAYLFREGKAPHIICTGNVGKGGIAPRPAALGMAEFLKMLGIEESAILTETKSESTHEHAVNLYPVFQERGFTNILLVTSAIHMPRSLATFRRLCPGVDFIPAPTDFRSTERIPSPWYRQLNALIPTPSHLLRFSEASHEYLGIAYYKLCGWI